MSKNEFDELLLKKLREADFEYNPASWEKLSQLLPPAASTTDGSFDALLLKKLQEEEMEYKAERWEQLAAMLPPALTPVADSNRLIPAGGNRKWRLAAGIAAALLLAFSTAILLKQPRTPDTEDNTTSLVQHLPETKIKPATPQSASPAAPQQTLQNPVTTTTPHTLSPLHNNSGTAATQHQQNATSNVQYNPLHTPEQQPGMQQQPEQIAQNTPGPQHGTEKTVVPETQKVSITPSPERPAPETYAYNNYENSPFYEGRGNGNKSSKTSISLGGGVNYGNLNTGYTAGVTVRHKVSGDFFVDGTVAMMYNNNATNVAVNNGPSLSGTASRPASFNETQLSSPALDPIQKLYYVQFNPSVGYQLEKHVALSVGGDFQQMLNKKEEIVQPESNNSRVFPNFDVGLTTKSEFTITPNIQAGLMYREGLNNLLKSDGSKYVNRRYVQVQFKYNIPVN